MSRSNPALLFAALGDPTRYRIVTRLANGDALSIRDLHHGTRVTRQAITKHLVILARTGLVRSERRGRERCFSLSRAPLDDARQELAMLSRRWDDALERLRAHVER